MPNFDKVHTQRHNCNHFFIILFIVEGWSVHILSWNISGRNRSFVVECEQANIQLENLYPKDISTVRNVIQVINSLSFLITDDLIW